MTKYLINDERPPVEVQRIGSSAEDMEFYDRYFQNNFLWTYIMGGQDAPNRYFTADYTTELTYVQQSPIVHQIWARCCRAFDIDVKSHVGRCYLLGQSKDLDGPWHDDYDVEENAHIRTLVYYPINNRKNLHRGTEFEFEDGTREEVPYLQDHAVFFNAGMSHRGLSTSDTKSLRISLVFQCIDVNIIETGAFINTCGNDERLDNIIRPIVP